MSKGLGKMERAILAELDDEGFPVSSLALSTAKRLGWGVWTLESHLGMLRKQRDEGELTPEQYTEFVNFIRNDPRHDRHPQKLERKFSASFSRALKRLEQKGLIDRFQETTFERRGDTLFYIMYKVRGSPRRCRTVRVRLKGKLKDVRGDKAREEESQHKISPFPVRRETE